MTDRRRDPRFSFATAVVGGLRLREEVVVERREGRTIELISANSCLPGECLTLELAGDGAARMTVLVSGVRPVVAADGSVRYRVHVEVQEPAGRDVAIPGGAGPA